MRKFVFGSDLQYQNLKAELEDDACHVFNNCELPSCFSQRKCRIGFEKDYGVYYLLIDSGISCSKNSGRQIMVQCRQWLSAGEYMFLDFNDMKSFLKGLRILYEL